MIHRIRTLAFVLALLLSALWLMAQTAPKAIVLYWQPGPTPAGFALYDYCVIKGLSQAEIKGRFGCPIHVPAGVTTYRDVDVFFGTTYYYAVRAEFQSNASFAGGSGATAVARISGGRVESVTVTSGGSGYDQNGTGFLYQQGQNTPGGVVAVSGGGGRGAKIYCTNAVGSAVFSSIQSCGVNGTSGTCTANGNNSGGECGTGYASTPAITIPANSYDTTYHRILLSAESNIVLASLGGVISGGPPPDSVWPFSHRLFLPLYIGVPSLRGWGPAPADAIGFDLKSFCGIGRHLKRSQRFRGTTSH